MASQSPESGQPHRLRREGHVLWLLLALGASDLLAQEAPREFNVWVMADPHLMKDIYHGAIPKEKRRRHMEREALGDAIAQSEAEQGFEWDLALCLGDFSARQQLPDEAEGREVVRQFSRLSKHRREQIYSLSGNHDASVENRWFQEWIDPLGEQTGTSGVDAGRRPYPIEGEWDHYRFRAHNLLFLMMSDRNEFPPPVGRIVGGTASDGRPAGAVTQRTFEWWQKQLAENPDSIIISAHHHMLKGTTIASGAGEAFRLPVSERSGPKQPDYHGYFKEDGEHNQGAGYLYWLVDESCVPIEFKPDAQAFEQHLDAHPGAIDFWLGGHTHSHPDDERHGRKLSARKWGVNFLNCAPLTRFHGWKGATPMSRLLTFTDGSDQVRVRCYLHTDELAPQGFYEPAEYTARLSKPFVMN